MEYLPGHPGRISLTAGAVPNAKSSRQKKVFSNHLMNDIHYFPPAGILVGPGSYAVWDCGFQFFCAQPEIRYRIIPDPSEDETESVWKKLLKFIG